MSDQPSDQLPDLLSEELPNDLLDSPAPSPDDVVDPLPPPERTVAGLDESDFVIVTGQFIGADLALYTVEIMPVKPRPPVP